MQRLCSRFVAALTFSAALVSQACAADLPGGLLLVGAVGGVWRIDPSNGDREIVVDFGGNNQFVGGLAIGPDGNLYATAVMSLPYSSRLMRYDPVANEATLVRDLGFIVGGGVTFDGGDVLVALRNSDPGGGGTVVRIDPMTGDLSSANSPSTTAYDVLAGPDDSYFVASTAGILRVNETTGAFSHVSTLPTGGLTWGPDGNIYATTLGSRVFRVDPETGDSVDVAMSAGGVGGGLAFDVDGSLLVSYHGSGTGVPSTIGGNLSRFVLPDGNQNIVAGFGAIYDVLVVPEPTPAHFVWSLVLYVVAWQGITCSRRGDAKTAAKLP